jgi:hypothetical protein
VQPPTNVSVEPSTPPHTGPSSRPKHPETCLVLLLVLLLGGGSTARRFFQVRGGSYQRADDYQLRILSVAAITTLSVVRAA